MQRYDQSANYCMIYAAQVPWRSWIQALSRNHKTSGEKCYKLDWNPDPSNAPDQKRADALAMEESTAPVFCILMFGIRQSPKASIEFQLCRLSKRRDLSLKEHPSLFLS
jgi:hypothetical protein